MEERHQRILQSILAAELLLELYRRAVIERKRLVSMRALQLRQAMLRVLQDTRQRWRERSQAGEPNWTKG